VNVRRQPVEVEIPVAAVSHKGVATGDSAVIADGRQPSLKQGINLAGGRRLVLKTAGTLIDERGEAAIYVVTRRVAHRWRNSGHRMMGKRRAAVPALSLPGVEEGGRGAGGGGGGGGVHLPAPAREVVILAENALKGADILHGMLQDVHLEKKNKIALLYLIKGTEQQHCNENRIYVFPEKELRGLSPNSYVHVSVSDLYIPGTRHLYWILIGPSFAVQLKCLGGLYN
jgi:hypothetical protein